MVAAVVISNTEQDKQKTWRVPIVITWNTFFFFLYGWYQMDLETVNFTRLGYFLYLQEKSLYVQFLILYAMAKKNH